jgi:hypothetical protein
LGLRLSGCQHGSYRFFILGLRLTANHLEPEAAQAERDEAPEIARTRK